MTAAQIAEAAGVSSGVVRGLAEAGALQAIDVPTDPPFPPVNPDLPGANLTAEQAEAAEELRGSARPLRPGIPACRTRNAGALGARRRMGARGS